MDLRRYSSCQFSIPTSLDTTLPKLPINIRPEALYCFVGILYLPFHCPAQEDPLRIGGTCQLHIPAKLDLTVPTRGSNFLLPFDRWSSPYCDIMQ